MRTPCSWQFTERFFFNLRGDIMLSPVGDGIFKAWKPHQPVQEPMNYGMSWVAMDTNHTLWDYIYSDQGRVMSHRVFQILMEKIQYVSTPRSYSDMVRTRDLLNGISRVLVTTGYKTQWILMIIWEVPNKVVLMSVFLSLADNLPIR